MDLITMSIGEVDVTDLVHAPLRLEIGAWRSSFVLLLPGAIGAYARRQKFVPSRCCVAIEWPEDGKRGLAARYAPEVGYWEEERNVPGTCRR